MQAIATETTTTPRTRAKKATKPALTMATLDRRELLVELTHAARMSERRTSIPLLANVLLSVRSGAVDLRSTNLDLTLLTWVAGETEGSGSVSLPARKLLGIVKSCAPGDVRITLHQERVDIESGTARWSLRAYSGEDFPASPEFVAESALELDSFTLQRLIALTRFAISREESRFQLAGALLVCTKSGATMASTDGHRLAIAEAVSGEQVVVKKDARVLIPSKALADLPKLCAGVATVEYASGETHGTFRCGRRELIVRLLEGVFPDYERVVSRDLTAKATLDRLAFSQAIARMQQTIGERARGVLLRFSEGACRLASWDPDNGQGADVVPCVLDGAEAKGISIGFSAEYVQQTLAAIESSEVSINMLNGESQAIFRPIDPSGVEDIRYLCVVMPMNMWEMPEWPAG
jgi:DNA polymerase III subunit beta